MKIAKTPAELGFRMPAEWQRHSATWMAWPHNRDTWPTNLADAQLEFITLACTIGCDEPVIIIAPDEQAEPLTDAICSSSIADSRIWTSNTPTNDAWIRDYGPTFVTLENQMAAIDWQYNAWGGKYPPFDADQQVATAVAKQLPPHTHDKMEIPVFRSELCIEGGAIEVNGEGLLLCTRSCALDENRNPGWTPKAIEQQLHDCLGVDQIIWLSGDAITGDDTDGHIDQLARFVPADKIVHAWTHDQHDPQRGPLEKNLYQLSAAIDKLDRHVELIPLPLPEPVVYNGNRLPASYCNFYITNNLVIVPQYNQLVADERAIGILASVFPNRDVIGLPSLHLNVGLGSFHCLTQQQPAIQRDLAKS